MNKTVFKHGFFPAINIKKLYQGLSMKICRALIITTSLLFATMEISAESEDVEKLRAEQIKKWGTTGLPKPQILITKAEALLKKPIGDQTIKELKELAESTNKAANYVGYILKQYASYYRENYKYDFVQEKIAPFHDKYFVTSNKLKSFRNHAYFNIGTKLAGSGNDAEAFFYFRDAYRLTSFTDEKGDHKGMRYKAEREMLKLLELGDIESFVYWK
jgi:hypothetical protein